MTYEKYQKEITFCLAIFLEKGFVKIISYFINLFQPILHFFIP